MKKVLIIIIIALNILTATVVISDLYQQKEWEDTRQTVTLRIQSGDTLYGYWLEYAPDWMSYSQYTYEIMELNNMKSCSIYAGQTIQIYVEE